MCVLTAETSLVQEGDLNRETRQATVRCIHLLFRQGVSESTTGYIQLYLLVRCSTSYGSSIRTILETLREYDLGLYLELVTKFKGQNQDDAYMNHITLYYPLEEPHLVYDSLHSPGGAKDTTVDTRQALTSTSGIYCGSRLKNRSYLTIVSKNCRVTAECWYRLT